MTQNNDSQKNFIILADHPALDLLNTVLQKEGHLIDFLQDDADVIQLMSQLQLLPTDPLPIFERNKLLKATKILREHIRSLLIHYRKGMDCDFKVLNQYLKHCASYTMLTADLPLPQKHTVYLSHSPQQFLAPFVYATIDLLLKNERSLIKNCEHPECILWFYDRTKSHRRRWCSMTTCGNRHKVANFRKNKLGSLLS